MNDLKGGTGGTRARRRVPRVPLKGDALMLLNQPESGLFYLYSIERAGGACWWKRSRHGYTAHIAEAGCFSIDEVNEILAQSRGGDLPVPASLISMITDVARGLSGRTTP